MAILKTQHDADLGLFDDCDVGTRFREHEVGRLRRLADCRRPSTPPVTRSSEIVSAWPAWRAALAAYAADPALEAATDRHEAFVRRLLTVPARTFEGLIAKARAFDLLLGDDDALARAPESDFDAFGLNESVLARDLIRLVRADAPPADPIRPAAAIRPKR